MTINKEIVARYIPANSQNKNGEIQYDYSDGKIKGMKFLNEQILMVYSSEPNVLEVRSASNLELLCDPIELE